MPEFCPLVTRRLVELQRALGPELRARTRIVAVSIDPEHDTPPILERYARDKGLSPETTALLTGPEREVALLSSYFGLEYWPEADGTIAHKVRLAVIDTRGRLHARLQGTDWTTDEILRLVRQALAEAGA
jgi:protein SCO1/2